MNKVLIVAYSFPPVGGAGVQRPLKFVKYLREYGWEPVVLTVSNPSVPVIDEGLLRDLPNGISIYRTPTLEPSYQAKKSCSHADGGRFGRIKAAVRKAAALIMLPDVQILWWPGLVRGLLGAIAREKPSCIFVTAPPFSSFLPVVLLGSVKNIPVVVDFRDEWSFSRKHLENSTKNRFAERLDYYFEKYSVTASAAFTAANESYIDSLHSTHPGIRKEKGVVITNGYDEEDFCDLESPAPPALDSEIITIVYAGTVWNATSLKPFAAALRTVLQSRPDLRDKLLLKVFGRVLDAEKECLLDDELKQVVVIHGYREHDEIIREMVGADILLLTLSDLPGAHKIITGKAFEYMATGRHILAVVPEGETKTLISSGYDNATYAHPADIGGIAAALRDLLSTVKNLRMKRGRDVSRYSRRRLTGNLASVFDRVTSGSLT